MKTSVNSGLVPWLPAAGGRAALRPPELPRSVEAVDAAVTASTQGADLRAC
jgi:hypothetical protein